MLLSDTRNICSTFLACAKKVTKKARPIFLPAGRQECGKFRLLNISSAKIGSPKPNFLEHFLPNNKQNGINCFGWSPDTDRVTEMIRQEFLFGNFKMSFWSDALQSEQVPTRHPKVGMLIYFFKSKTTFAFFCSSDEIKTS